MQTLLLILVYGTRQLSWVSGCYQLELSSIWCDRIINIARGSYTTECGYLVPLVRPFLYLFVIVHIVKVGLDRALVG